MEPYRPYVDRLVIDLYQAGYKSITTEVKTKLLSLASTEVHINGKRSPLMVAASVENAQVHIRRVKSILPEYGKVVILSITDKQFGEMELFVGKEETALPTEDIQLELF